MTRPAGVVLVGYGRAEERHYSITRELDDRPLVLVNLVHQKPEAPVHEPVNLFRIKFLSNGCVVNYICKKGCDELAFPFDSPSVVDNFLRQKLGCVRPGMCIINS